MLESADDVVDTVAGSAVDAVVGAGEDVSTEGAGDGTNDSNIPPE